MSALFITCERCEPVLWYYGVILMPLFVGIVLVLVLVLVASVLVLVLVSEVLVLVLVLEPTVLETPLLNSKCSQLGIQLLRSVIKSDAEKALIPVVRDVFGTHVVGLRCCS